MQETWRWFGPNDPVTLANIIQAGASGVVTSLHDIPTGEAWPPEAVMARKNDIEASGLSWSVVESIPLHNDIKTRTGNYQRYIENYKTSIRSVSKAGIKVVCYNFMPVVDWTRTNLMYKLPNESYALRFEMTDFAAYDVYLLQRENAAADYDEQILEKAKQRFDGMTDEERILLEENIIAGLPGGEGSYTRESIREAIAEFIALGVENFRQNLIKFLQEVIPVAEEEGVRLCIHPDDPPFSLFGLPRVMSTADDAQKIMDAVPSVSNGLTLCAGSFGARGDNNLIQMVKQFGPKIHFVHLRNVKRATDGSFFEAEHLEGDNDMIGLISALLEEEQQRRAQGRDDLQIPMRPDHGHLLGHELEANNANPGYSFAGRMKGLAELRGVMHVLEKLRH